MSNRKQGFTLLEILLVVAAIGILAGIVIVALNPGKQLGDTRNAQRKVDVNTILNAIYQYSIDNNGVIPTEITSGVLQICVTDGTCTGMADLSDLTNNQTYLVSMPTDPQATTTDGTGYYVNQTANGRVTVKALAAEQSAVINVTR